MREPTTRRAILSGQGHGSLKGSPRSSMYLLNPTPSQCCVSPQLRSAAARTQLPYHSAPPLRFTGRLHRRSIEFRDVAELEDHRARDDSTVVSLKQPNQTTFFLELFRLHSEAKEPAQNFAAANRGADSRSAVSEPPPTAFLDCTDS